jgi:biotin transport system substrate-specific component
VYGLLACSASIEIIDNLTSLRENAVSNAPNYPASAAVSATRASPRFAAVWLPLKLVAGSLVMVLCAKATIPFWPVPMTMQVFGALVLAGLFDGRVAALMVLTYLAEGAAGLPVFSHSPTAGAGLGYLAGPTGGYLAGFAIAAFVTGSWIERRGSGNSWWMLLPMMAGLGIIYLVGCLWLSLFVPASKIAAVGITPFILGDLLKVALAAASCLAVRQIARRVR